MKEKIFMLKSIVRDINDEISSHRGTFYWDVDNECKEEYMNKYYPSFDVLIEKAKIWVDLNLEHIDYYLLSTKYYIDGKLIELNEKDLESIKIVYCNTINEMIDKTNRLEYLDLIYNVIRKRITDKNLLSVIEKSQNYDNVVTNLDIVVSIIVSSLNRFISNISALYKISNKSSEKEHLDCMIDDLKNNYLMRVNEMLGNWHIISFIDEIIYQQYKKQ